MNDWNKNGRYDLQDRFLDYQGANEETSDSGVSANWWIWPLFAIIAGVCLPLGIVIAIGIMIFGR